MKDYSKYVPPTQEMWNEAAAIKLRLYWLKHKLATQFSEEVKTLNANTQKDLSNWQEPPISWLAAMSETVFKGQLLVYKLKEEVYLAHLSNFLTKRKMKTLA